MKTKLIRHSRIFIYFFPFIPVATDRKREQLPREWSVQAKDVEHARRRVSDIGLSWNRKLAVTNIVEIYIFGKLQEWGDMFGFLLDGQKELAWRKMQ